MNQTFHNRSGTDAEVIATLTAIRQLPDSLEEFSIDSWNSLVKYATVYSTDDIRFTPKKGKKITT